MFPVELILLKNIVAPHKNIDNNCHKKQKKYFTWNVGKGSIKPLNTIMKIR